MAKQKVYGFKDAESFNRVRKATRKVLGERGHGAQRRRQSPVVGSLPFLGKADANIASRASGTVSVYNGTLGSETDSGSNVSAFNITDQQADINTWVLLIRMAGGLALLPLQCPG